MCMSEGGMGCGWVSSPAQLSVLFFSHAWGELWNEVTCYMFQLYSNESCVLYYMFSTYTYLPEGQRSWPSPLMPVPSSSVSPHGTHPCWDGKHEDSHPDQMSESRRKPA